MENIDIELPRVSILIITKNRRDDLRLAIESIKHLNYPKTHYEIVVVEETNKPKTLKGVRYISIPEENRGFDYNRTIALNNAKYSIVAFTDDDCQVEKNWLRELVAPFQHGAAAVAGAVLVKNCGSIGYCENTLGFPGGGIKYVHRSGNKIKPTNRLSTCNAAFLKKIILDVNGFTPNTPFGGEDFLLAEKIVYNHPCYYNPKAIVYHKPRQRFWAIFKWFIRRGRSEMTVVELADKKKGHILWNIFTSISLRLVVLIILVFVLKLNFFLWLPLIFLAYYILTIFRYKYILQYYKDYKALLLIPIVKLIMDFGMDCGRILHLTKKLIRISKKKDEKNE